MKQADNVLMIVSDDQATWGTGFGGNDEIRTPVLDGLANSGMVYENSYCTSPVCSPARSSLLTGLMPSQTGVLDWIAADNVDGKPYLAPGTAMTEVLSDGMTRSLSGKWHLGASRRPQAGYSHWYVHAQDGGPYHGAPMIRAGEEYREPGYVTTAITDDAIEVIRENAAADRPFFASVHYTAPHAPWVDQHPPDLVAMYDDCAFASCPQESIHPWFHGFRSPRGEAQPVHPLMEEARRDPRPSLQGLFASITAMDRDLGRLLDVLDETGLRESTLVVFTSDNGFNAGHHGIWGKGNGTWPQNMYETSVKVPLVLNQPGTIAPGTSDALVSAYDLRPTILEALGATDPLREAIPGRSLLAGRSGNEHVVVCDEYGPVRMIRTDRWKLVRRHWYGPDELYDLVDDPSESHNRIDDATLVRTRAELDDRLRQWFTDLVDVRFDGRNYEVSGRGQLAPLEGRSAAASFRPASVPIEPW